MNESDLLHDLQAVFKGEWSDAVISRAFLSVKNTVKWNSPFYGVESGLAPVVTRLREVGEGVLLQKVHR